MNKSAITIRKYDQLLLEKQRLTLVLQQQELVVKAELNNILQELRPITGFVSQVQKLTSRNYSNPIFAIGTNLIIDILLRKIILRKAGWVSRLILPIILKNYISHGAVDPNRMISKIVGFIKHRLKS